MSNGSPAETADDKSPWTQPRFVASAVVVGLIVVLGLVFILIGPGGGAESPGVVTPPPASSTSSSSACDLPDGDQSVPTGAPADTRWELVGRMVAPTSPTTIGPKHRIRGIRSCFARSPLGALYAAVNVVATASDPDRWEGLARELAAPGRGRSRALSEVADQAAAPDDRTRMQVAGFSFTTYDRSAAVISIAFRVDTGATAFTAYLPMSLKWQKGDWRFVIADNGDPFAGLGRIPDLTGYVLWSGA